MDSTPWHRFRQNDAGSSAPGNRQAIPMMATAPRWRARGFLGLGGPSIATFQQLVEQLQIPRDEVRLGLDELLAMLAHRLHALEVESHEGFHGLAMVLERIALRG